MHGFLLEFGVIFPAGYAALDRVSGLMHSRELPIRLINAIERMLEDIRQLTGEIKKLDVEIKQNLVQSDAGQRLQSIPGIDPLIASALVADVGDASVSKSSRDFVASLGMVPRQYSTGSETVLLGISKRGGKYLRSLLVQGAHTVLYRVDYRSDALGRWAKNLLARKPLKSPAPWRTKWPESSGCY